MVTSYTLNYSNLSNQQFPRINQPHLKQYRIYYRWLQHDSSLFLHSAQQFQSSSNYSQPLSMQNNQYRNIYPSTYPYTMILLQIKQATYRMQSDCVHILHQDYMLNLPSPHSIYHRSNGKSTALFHPSSYYRKKYLRKYKYSRLILCMPSRIQNNMQGKICLRAKVLLGFCGYFSRNSMIYLWDHFALVFCLGLFIVFAIFISAGNIDPINDGGICFGLLPSINSPYLYLASKPLPYSLTFLPFFFVVNPLPFYFQYLPYKLFYRPLQQKIIDWEIDNFVYIIYTTIALSPMEADTTNIENEQKHWKIGTNQPFQGHKEKYAEIPQQNRKEFIIKMLKTPQINQPPPYNYRKPFPSESTFPYLEYTLNYYSIQNTPTPKAILVILHGLNSTGNAFGYLASRIAQKNPELNVYSFDQMNFGKSNGNLRGLVVSSDDSVKQVETFIQFLTNNLQSKPKIFLCGMSYGGTIAFKATIKSPSSYAGILLLAPALRDIQQNMYYGKRIMSYVGWLMPKLRIPQMTPSGLGTKYNLTQQFRDDPLIFTDYLMPGTIRSLMNAIAEITQLYSSFTAPFLCIASGIQKMVDPFAALDFEQQSPSKDKKLVYCQTMWHAIMYEQEVVGVSWHCAEWLRQRI